jgi:hypothetical protein
MISGFSQFVASGKLAWKNYLPTAESTARIEEFVTETNKI